MNHALKNFETAKNWGPPCFARQISLSAASALRRRPVRNAGQPASKKGPAPAVRPALRGAMRRQKSDGEALKTEAPNGVSASLRAAAALSPHRGFYHGSSPQRRPSRAQTTSGRLAWADAPPVDDEPEEVPAPEAAGHQQSVELETENEEVAPEEDLSELTTKSSPSWKRLEKTVTEYVSRRNVTSSEYEQVRQRYEGHLNELKTLCETVGRPTWSDRPSQGEWRAKAGPDKRGALNFRELQDEKDFRDFLELRDPLLGSRAAVQRSSCSPRQAPPRRPAGGHGGHPQQRSPTSRKGSEKGRTTPEGPPEEDIKAAYKRQALRSHPDKGGSSEQFRLVVKAFEVLFNASARQSYDRQRQVQRRECPAAHPATTSWSAQQHKPSRSTASYGATQEEKTSVGRQHGTQQLRRSKPQILAFKNPANETTFSTEGGKHGVPRYDGDPTVLAEHAFRVRLLEAKINTMEKAEQAKQGPLGLRHFSLEGPKRPVNSQVGGALARQNTEPMVSYLLRRKTWYKMLLDLDPELKLPDPLLAEQILTSAGISRDHQLMVRTALQGKMTVASVCDELIAQHAKSLSGFDVDGSPSASAYVAAEHYDPEYAEEREDDPVADSYAALISEGLDEQNPEALEYAAEIMQIDAEAFYVHQRASQAGHTGFGREKGFGKYKGKLSADERKARIDAIKEDNLQEVRPDRPLVYGLLLPQESWTVYFSVNDYQTDEGVVPDIENQVMMVTKQEGHAQVPPPRVLQDGEVVRSPNEGVIVDNPPGDGRTADELLDAAIAEAHARRRAQQQPQQGHRPLPISAPAQAEAMVPVPEDTAFSDMDYEPDEMPPFMYGPQSLPQPQGLHGQAAFAAYPTEPPQQERFSAFPPVPALPGGHPSPLTAGSGSDAECQHVRTTKRGSNGPMEKITCLDCGKVLKHEARQAPTPSPMEVRDRRDCKHERKHYIGTTATTWKWTCTDCGHVETGRKNPGESGRYGSEQAPSRASSSMASSIATTSEASYAPTDQPGEVVALMQNSLAIQNEMGVDVTPQRLDIIYSKCRALVYGDGYAPATRPSHRSSPMPTSPASATARTPTSTAARTSQVPRSPVPTTPARSEASFRSAESAARGAREVNDEDLDAWDHEIVRGGKHNGKTFLWVFENDNQYCRFLFGKFNAGDLRDPSLIELARYVYKRPLIKTFPQSPQAYMVQNDNNDNHEIAEDTMVAVIDTGCNNTCHGSTWMEAYLKATGLQVPLEPYIGKFNGVGGKIKAVGIRRIPVTFSLEDGTEARGVIVSTELEGSNVPLLLSTKAQKSLGLLIDMHDNTVYSKIFEQHLQLVDRDGLPGLRLLPGDPDEASIALHSHDSTINIQDSDYDSDDNLASENDEKHQIEEEDTLGYLKLDEGSIKQLTKGQKKMLNDGITELEKEDAALWTTLREQNRPTRMPGRLLTRGCGVALLELFSGAATLTMMVASLGLPVAEPIDVVDNPAFDLLRPEGQRLVEQRIEQEDPMLLSMAPKCAPWSPLQNINEAKSEATLRNLIQSDDNGILSSNG
eukprot:s39_g27.t1